MLKKIRGNNTTAQVQAGDIVKMMMWENISTVKPLMNVDTKKIVKGHTNP